VSEPGAAITVRPGAPADAALIVHFVRELARFEKEPVEHVRMTEADVLANGFGERPYFETLIAEMDGEPVGMALFFHNFSTWEGKPGIYVEDVIVEERARGSGVGLALMRAVARTAVERDCRRIELAALDWNPAQGFYRRLGFRRQDEWELFRLDGDGLARLAGGD
jgi:GNAT superfamily N-acetyltransferase